MNAHNVSRFRKAMMLANKLAALRPLSTTNLTRKEWRSDNFNAAYILLDKYPNAAILYGTTTKGKASKRVVLTDWANYNEVKGTGRPTPSDSTLFVDLARYATGQRSNTCSFKHGMYTLIG